MKNAALVLVGLVLGLGLALAYQSLPRVPKVTGLYGSQAEDKLKAEGLRVAFSEQVRSRPVLKRIGRIRRQSPSPGRPVLRGARIRVSFAKPKTYASVPNVVGMTPGDAALALARVGLTTTYELPGVAPNKASTIDEAVKAIASQSGFITSQDATAGARLPFGALVRLGTVEPHTGGADAKDLAQATHGLYYLRYGFSSKTRGCGWCHSPSSCTGKGCHSGSAYKSFGVPGSLGR